MYYNKFDDTIRVFGKHNITYYDEQIVMSKQFNDLISKIEKLNIIIYENNNIDDNYCYVLFESLNDQNIDIMESLMLEDDRYFYDELNEKYGIRSNLQGLDAMEELLELVNAFVSQKEIVKAKNR